MKTIILRKILPSRLHVICLAMLGLLLISAFAPLYKVKGGEGFWWDYSWQFRKKLTIDHTKVVGNLTNFPVLISITDADLSGKAQSSGGDIVFTDSYGIKLKHELEYYGAISGNLVAWVNIPFLSSSVDTILYMYYGNPSAVNQQDPRGVWDTSYVLVDHLKETSGAVLDSSTYSTNGTANSGVSQGVAGKISGACSFNGVGGYIQVGDADSLDGMSTMTIEVWVKQSTYHDNGILNKGGAGGISYLLQGWSDSAMYWQVNGQGNRAVAPAGSYPVNEWYHLVGVSTGTQLLIYVNGVQKTSSSKTTTVPVDSYPVQMGQNGVGVYFSGLLDEARISRTARSAEWISTEYSNQNNPSTFYTLGAEETPPEEITISNETPANGTTNVILNPTLTAYFAYYQEQMNITLSTNATGTWQTIKSYTNVNSSYYSANTTSMNQYQTTYYWKARAEDLAQGKSAEQTYSFTTKPLNVAPLVSDPSPANSSTNVSASLTRLDFNLTDIENDAINYTVTTIPDIGSGSGTNVHNGRYSVSIIGLKHSTSYTWTVEATDGKDSREASYTFTTGPITTGVETLGDYACMGLGYMGSATDKNVAYAVWQGPIDVQAGLANWFAEFDKTQGWVVKNQSVFSEPWGERHPFYGYWGGKYHVGWFDGAATRIAFVDSDTFEGLQAVNGATSQYYLPGSIPGNSVPSAYAFNDSYAWVMGSDTSTGDEAIAYWTWNSSTGWSGKNLIMETANASHATNFPALLPVNATALYVYYTAYGSAGPQLYYVKSADQGQTWSAEQASNIASDVSSNSRPSFARYGDNFYIFLIDTLGQVMIYNSTDGQTWGNKQVLDTAGFEVAQGYAVDQKTLVWTASNTYQYKRSSTGHYGVGDQVGGVYLIPEMQSSPSTPTLSYPSDGMGLSLGTTTAQLRVVVHGSQVYDVAFYWANGTFIGENKLLAGGDTATVTVSGLSDGQTYQWYAVARGATYGFWGGQPATTSDEKRTSTWTFNVQAKQEPYITTEYPQNGIIGANLNPILAVNVTDYQGDLMNVTFSTNATGTWQAIGTYFNVGNGRYSANTTNMGQPVTKYYWKVDATDGAHPSAQVYGFVTRHLPGPWWNPDWLYRRLIVIDHTKVNGSLTNFPVSIDVTDPNLAYHTQGNGGDIAFTDFSGNKLAHEIECFNQSGGRLVVWVNVPVLSATNDTFIYMYYGNDVASNQENAKAVWDSNYLMVLHFKETSGNHLDSTKYGNDGKPEGGLAQGGTGKIDGSDYFDGVSACVTVPDENADLGGMGQLTIETWAKQPTYHDNGMVEKGGLGGYLLQGWSDQQMYFAVGGVENGIRAIAPSGSYPLNEWYYLVGEFDGSTISIYVDGILKNSTGKSATVPSSTQPLHIGYNGAGSYFNGLMDEVRISNVSRSTSWIMTEYNNQQDPHAFCLLEGEERGTPPERPVVSGESPISGTVGVNVNPTLSANIMDYQGDLMNVTFSTNATGTWQAIGAYSNVADGRYNVTPTTMNPYETQYWWKVYAIDTKPNSTERLYTFTTRPQNYVPTVFDPSPSNGATGIPLTTTVLSFRLKDLDGDPLDYVVTTSPDVGNSSGQHVGNGVYYAYVSKLQVSTWYTWTVNVTDGKNWTAVDYTFLTQSGPPTVIGAYYCAGLGYIGGPDANGNFYAVWQQLTNTQIRNWTEPAGPCTLYWGRYNSTSRSWDVIDQIVTNNYEAWGTHPAWGYWDNQYHVIWDVWAQYYEQTMGSSTWQGFGSMSYSRDHVSIDGYNGEDAVATSYSFDNEHAWVFITQVANGKHAITYVPWSKDSGWGPKVRINSTENFGRVDCGSLLPVNRNKYIVYYTTYPSGYNQLRYVISTDQGQTWGPEQISSISPDLGVNIRPTFARYGDTFYIFLLDNAGRIVLYESTDGVNWGSKQIISTYSSWQWPTGVLMDQKDLIWTGSDLNQWYSYGSGTGDQVGGIYSIPELRANPGKPTNIYPANGESIGLGTKSVQLKVQVSGNQTYDVAFYWGNGTYIGMDRLLRNGDTATISVEVSDNTLYEWYAVARGSTQSYWGPPKSTTDEQRSDTSEFGVGIGEQPYVVQVTPEDRATDIEFNPTLSAHVLDFQGDLMNITISTNVTGAWRDIVAYTSVGSGIYNATLTGVDRYGWKYYWKVTAIDSVSGKSNVTTGIYSFTTIQKSIFDPFDEGWRYRKLLKINHTMVSADLTNFQVLIDITDPDLASKAQANAGDILFMNGTGVSQKLSHEVECFNSTTGHFTAWVRIPFLSSTMDTVIYMYYGNPSCGDQQNILGTWDDTYEMVQHFNGASSTITDSTHNDMDGTSYNGASQDTPGVINKAVSFYATNDYAEFPSIDLTSQITVEAWIKAKRQDNWQTVFARGSSKTESWYSAWDTASGTAYRIQWWITDSNNVRRDMYGTTALTDDYTWYYIVLTYDGARQTGYVDGQEEAHVDWTGTIKSSSEDILLGRNLIWGEQLNGAIDEFRISNIARSSAWISATYNNQHYQSSFLTIAQEEEDKAPSVSYPSPQDGSVGIPKSLSALAFDLLDYQGALMNYTVKTFPNIGSGSGTNIANGHYSISVADLTYSSTYTWTVCATDGQLWTNKTFTFNTQSAFDLIANSIRVITDGGNIYCNATYANGTTYYYPVEVVIQNTGIEATDPFYVKLEVYWANASSPQSSSEMLVSSLDAGSTLTLSFTSLFHPVQTGYYRLNATVDSHNNIAESNKTNNTIEANNIPANVTGDINGDGTVNLFDAIAVSLAWGANQTSPRWNTKADLNHDGTINILDATMLSLHWGEKN